MKRERSITTYDLRGVCNPSRHLEREAEVLEFLAEQRESDTEAALHEIAQQGFVRMEA